MIDPNQTARAEAVMKLDERQLVCLDMSVDLGAQIRERSRYLARPIVNRSVDSLTKYGVACCNFNIITDIMIDYPELGVATGDSDEDFRRILKVSSFVGKEVVGGSFQETKYPLLQHRRLLRDGGDPISPFNFTLDSWAYDYADRMTEAMYLGLDHTVEQPQEIR